MKQIFLNTYLKTYTFDGYDDLKNFLKKNDNKKTLTLKETFGDFYYCFTLCDSLTGDKDFIISFSSDEKIENISILFWARFDLIVLNTGNLIYLIDKKIGIIDKYNVATPLIGFYEIDDKLLILEEASLKIINQNGENLKSKQFDLITDFSIREKILYIKTNNDEQIKFDMNLL